MEKIKNYVLPENTNRLYREEASSSIGLTRDVAAKINELVDAYNRLFEEDLKWKQTQEGTIRKGIIYMKDNLVNAIQDLFDSLDERGVIDDRIALHTALLKARLDNLLGAVTEGSTTLDAEVIDGRVAADGVKYASIGEAIRNQIHKELKNVYLYHNIEYDTATGTVKLLSVDGNVLYTSFNRGYGVIHTLTAKTATAAYNASLGRPHIVSLNTANEEAELKCYAINAYTPSADELILFMIYQNRVVPLGLAPECIIVDGKRFSDNPPTKKKYAGNIVGLTGKLTINQETLTMTLGAGLYMFPLYRTGIVTLAEKSVAYTITKVAQYLVYDIEEDNLFIGDRFKTFKDSEFCLGILYEGKLTPIEMTMDSIIYTAAGNKEVIDSQKHFITMNDMFKGLSDLSKKTKIVLGGDSITHGVGGTGFAQNGTDIITVGSTTYKRNSGYCWAKLFKDYIESNYNAEVINNGCTGTYSTWWDNNKATLIPSDTDIFILTIGTNDRDSRDSVTTKALALENYYQRLSSIVEYCHKNGIQIVLCSPIPATAANEAEKLANVFEMNEVIRRVAAEHSMDYANVYNEVFYHIMDHELSLATLLPDGLHPADAMYQLMFYKYLKCFNMAPSYEALE